MMMTIAERLKGLRKSNQRTLSHVSKWTGLSVGFISDVERGRVIPSLKSCQIFANYYIMDLEDLFMDVKVEAE